ncbi:MAG: Tll0287-like domain-containing protein [Nitrospiraceae bacterium]
MTQPKSLACFLMGCLVLMSGDIYAKDPMHAKDATTPSGISPEKVADFIHAVIKADRTVYTNQVVNRMQEKGIVSAAEHWENENALPLPAQFLQHSGKLVAEAGPGIRYRLISLWPIYQRNAPATPIERKALEAVGANPDRPFTSTVSSGRKQYFQAVYADRAVSKICVSCHNSHPLSPKRDFKVNDVMGGIAITIPLE